MKSLSGKYVVIVEARWHCGSVLTPGKVTVKQYIVKP